MDCVGQEFNSDIHEALSMIEVDDESKKGKVSIVLEKGYLLNETVIRCAKVVVGN